MSEIIRPPAIPLVTVDPYFSVWSMADHLYDDNTKHWTGKTQGMAGMVMIDGKVLRFLGKVKGENIPVMTQTGVRVEPLSSTYTFEAEGVVLEVKFTTPLLMDDLDLLSRPASYISFKVHTTDGREHKVKVYFDATGEWCVNRPDQSVVWSRKYIKDNIDVMSMGTKEQPVLAASGDDRRIDWGYFTLVLPRTRSICSCINSEEIRKEFAKTGNLYPQDDTDMPRRVMDNMPVMACVVDFGNCGKDTLDYYLVLAYDDIDSIEYFQKPLKAYWRRNGMTFEEMLFASIKEYENIMEKCRRFDEQLISEGIDAGGSKYADILSVSYRQAINAHKLAADENGEALFFSKECYSNGCIATVDVSYPSMPLFLLYNPELVKGMMRPIFKLAGSDKWPHDFAPHDVGTYPKANGQVYRLNRASTVLETQMPVEECGNMLVMAAAVCLAEGNADFAFENLKYLKKWAEYLTENGLDPGEQLCTDDFAGRLAHNANLSIKAIMGIAGYGVICGMLGDDPEMKKYLQTAREMAREWFWRAEEGDHFRLAFDKPCTWSQKYNLVWDILLQTGIFDPYIAENEVAYYLKVQQRYGLPLDNRQSYTKADWILWSAALAKSRDDFEKLVNPLWDFLNETIHRVPFSDWYDTKTGHMIRFQNRSVVGGMFIKLLKDKWLKI